MDEFSITAIAYQLAEFVYHRDGIAGDTLPLHNVERQDDVAKENVTIKVKYEGLVIANEVYWDAKWWDCCRS